MSKNLHGNVILYKDLKKTLPKRKFFLDPASHNKVSEQLADGEDVLFLPTGLQEANIQDVKYEKALYKIILYGVFIDGRKVVVVLDGIIPYFEVMIPKPDDEGFIKRVFAGKVEYLTKSQYTNVILELLQSEDLTPIKKENLQAKPFKYYQEHKNNFIRLYFNKLAQRTKAIELVRKNGYATTHDDLRSYYRVVCRDYLTTFSSWVIMKKYHEEDMSDRFKGDVYRVKINNFKQYEGELSLKNTPELVRDKTMSMTWDIETFSPDGDIPQPGNPDDRIFCIGMTFQWASIMQPFLKIALVEYPSEANPEFLTVVCGSEINIIKAFATIFEYMRPEFLIGFNDSDYDWPWLVERASQTRGLLAIIAKRMDMHIPFNSVDDASVRQWSYKKEKVKIEADTYAHGQSLCVHGCINIDARTVFRRLYPTAEMSSLKFFLEKNKLSGKEDMPYKTMFKIYKDFVDLHSMKDIEWNPLTNCDFTTNQQELLKKYSTLKKDLMAVNKYCIVDALRCHELMNIRSVVMDSREVGKMFYTSVYDSFYRANGMKVRNLTIATGQDPKLSFNIRFSNITNTNFEDGKYPGAYVVPPEKGLQTSKLSLEERRLKAKIFNKITWQKKIKEAKKQGASLNQYEDIINLLNNPDTGDKPIPMSADLIHELQYWFNVDDAQIQRFYKIIEKHGPHIINEEKIKQIEDECGQLPPEFKSFLNEVMGRPITGLDFASLYPSLVMTYNLSPEKCILNKKYARGLLKRGTDLTAIKFPFNGRQCKAWFPKHENKLEPLKEDGTFEPDFRFGLYPFILFKLFNIRKSIKKIMKQYIHEIEQMDKQETLTPGYIKANYEHYEDICFQRNYYNAKQVALKLCMNTFYGECGNKLSPFFVLEVAGGITSQGVKNIKMAKEFVEKRGCSVKYGDTDSLYISIPELEFAEIDRLYYSNKISKMDYWVRLVEITFECIKRLNMDVNNLFIRDNGTTFLSMAYEEVLFPCALLAKKKYFGIPHENIVNFIKYAIFLRGLEVKKRGASDILKKIFTEIMETSLSPDNIMTLLELVERKIDEIYDREWKMTDFMQSAVFRPKKQNVKVRTFVERMRKEDIIVPVNERFQYVIVKKYPYFYDERGRKQEIKVGDKMEYLHVARDKGYSIDLDYYVSRSINGQLARLIVYHPQFHIDPVDDSIEASKLAEEKMYKMACKHVDTYCQKYYAKYNQFGDVYKTIFKTANANINTCLKTRDELAYKIINQNLKDKTYIDCLLESVEKIAEKIAQPYGGIHINNLLKEIPKENKSAYIVRLQNLYYGNNKQNTLLAIRKKNFIETNSILVNQLNQNADAYNKLYSNYKNSILDVASIFKSNLNIDNKLLEQSNMVCKYKIDDFKDDINDNTYEEMQLRSDENINKILNDEKSCNMLNQLKKIYINLLCAHITLENTKSIVNVLQSIRDKSARVTKRPSEETIQKNKEQDIAKLLSEDSTEI